MAKSSEQIVQEAAETLRKAQDSLDAGDAFYRNQGLNPAKVQSVLAEHVGAKERAEAEAQFRQDLEDIERETAEEVARERFASNASSGVGRKPRPMV